MVVLEELERARQTSRPADHAEERAALEREVASLQEREKRLVRLYTFGEIDDETVRAEGAELRRRRQVLEERLAALQPLEVPADHLIDPAMLERACGLVTRWLDQAGTEQRMLALEALQVAVAATRVAAIVTGVLPTEAPPFITDEPSSRCTFPGK
ncbi:MAG: hypothetical protein M3O34_18815 [Chloroflexota bacterium]|nr:hypothetical protein [Chloroflexota bacterium]